MSKVSGTKKSYWLKGALAGLINGLLGSAGGIIILSFLKANDNIDDKQAHATSVCVILPLCAASVIIYIMKGMFSLELSVTLTIGAGLGGILSGLLFKRVNSRFLNWVFVAITLIAGIGMLLERRDG